MEAHVLVPLKRLDRAKSRLGSTLPLGARADLMLDLLGGVVTAVRDAGVRRITIVTPERVTYDGADTWNDRGLEWNDALAAAARAVVRTELVAIISADLPLLAPADVSALLENAPRRGAAIGRAHDGGTNAVALRPPGAMPTLFGKTDSARLHAEAAQRRGLDHRVLDLPGIAFDVDTPADLERMQAQRAPAPDRATENPDWKGERAWPTTFRSTGPRAPSGSNAT